MMLLAFYLWVYDLADTHSLIKNIQFTAKIKSLPKKKMELIYIWN